MYRQCKLYVHRQCFLWTEFYLELHSVVNGGLLWVTPGLFVGFPVICMKLLTVGFPVNRINKSLSCELREGSSSCAHHEFSVSCEVHELSVKKFQLWNFSSTSHRALLSHGAQVLHDGELIAEGTIRRLAPEHDDVLQASENMIKPLLPCYNFPFLRFLLLSFFFLL